MEKNVGIPNSITPYDLDVSIYSKISNYLLFKYWSTRCKRLSYEPLLKNTVSVLVDILNSHNLESSFYQNLNFEAIIGTKTGWKLEFSKVYSGAEESIIIYLFQDKSFGQSSFTIVFKNQNGIITGIQNMFHGWATESYFHDLESPVLNPNVLAALIAAKGKLKNGYIKKIKISNETK